MAEMEKTTGVPVDDKALDGVSGGVVTPRDIEQMVIDRVKEEFKEEARELKPKNPVAVPKSPHYTPRND